MNTNNVLAVAGVLLISATVYTNFIDIPVNKPEITSEYHPEKPVPQEPLIPIDTINVTEQEIDEVEAQTSSIEMDKVEKEPVVEQTSKSTTKPVATTKKPEKKVVKKQVTKKASPKSKKGFIPYEYTFNRNFLIIPEGIDAEFNRVR